MNKKIVTLIISTSVIVLALIGYLLFNAGQLTERIRSVKSAQLIAKQALVFDRQICVARLSFWKYVNDPKQERRDKLNLDIQSLTDEYETLLLMAKNNLAAVYQGGVNDIEIMGRDLKRIEEITEPALLAVNDYEKLIAEMRTKSALERLQSPAVAQSVTVLRQTSFEVENLYDEIGLDEKNSSIVAAQNKLTGEIEKELGALRQWSNIATVALALVYLVLLALIAVWLGRLIKETRINCLKLNNK